MTPVRSIDGPSLAPAKVVAVMAGTAGVTLLPALLAAAGVSTGRAREDCAARGVVTAWAVEVGVVVDGATSGS